MTNSQTASAALVVKTIGELGKGQGDALALVAKEIKELAGANEERFEKLRETVDAKLNQLRESNEAKLEEMRRTVDEKLHDTLEKRLGESFKLVSDQLEAVQSGLGEMRSLATGVGDLKKVLSNVKTRGILGEVQLGAILEEMLTVNQYGTNVRTKPDSGENVEFAVRLPGSDVDTDKCVWLPIDSKFPQEDYVRLVDAADAGDAEAVKEATQSLIRSVKKCAKDISEKYISPPDTTDFAIMFLPTEGLYAEVLRQPGFLDELMRTHRIVVAGPTTLAAILSSLRMGFRTLAIEKRSSERQLATASKTVEATGVRTRAIERKLRGVEELPDSQSEAILALSAVAVEDAEIVDDEAVGDED
jgi:DNA recombination protein RmuC